MIRSFADKHADAFFRDGICHRQWRAFEQAAARKLDALDAAVTLADLRSPPGNRPESLHGDRNGQHSIRIDDQWRICFRWTPQGPEAVEIVAYHWSLRPDVLENWTRGMPRLRTHPGEYLSEEYLKPLNLSARQLAQSIAVPPNRIADIVRERRGISADTALRLGRYFGTSAQFWINMQTGHDLSKAEAEIDLSKITPRQAVSA